MAEKDVTQKFNKQLEVLVGKPLTRQSLQNHKTRDRLFLSIISNRKIPEKGWEDTLILDFLSRFCLLDSNNFINKCGSGEREGRVFSKLVSHRHFGFSHGVGRSGDLAALQPKAVGSSAISRLANALVLSLVRSDIGCVKSAAILPFATGMALTFCFVCLKQDIKLNPDKKRLKVVWPRIDQKTCFKAILTADCDPVIIENNLEDGDEVVTDLMAVENAVKSLFRDNSPCIVVSTTSCFAPRAPEDVVKVAQICKKYGVPHVVNNAYGFQSKKTSVMIEKACRRGRVDCIVMSTDKNFMVPVGGAIIASPDPDFVPKVSELYPGRASISPTLDLLITLLSMGQTGYNIQRAEREKKFIDFRSKLSQIAEKHGERLLKTTNPISLAITLNRPASTAKVGAKLFNAYCFGARCVERNAKKNIGGTEFEGYGAHCDHYPHNYLACAVAIGATEEELDTFLKRLDKILRRAD